IYGRITAAANNAKAMLRLSIPFSLPIFFIFLCQYCKVSTFANASFVRTLSQESEFLKMF
ncbi:hypothetical protein, partial [Acinetobacter baumannii]|uniref:hypothetical protein n=1 Tax=Acinetobacter baumannii TaxID=470 RepID=UPI0021D478F0